jgi:2-polyprenyl-3-methyl-5-hydroxy-6-metoxy-1,4-benzoquinol methylase
LPTTSNAALHSVDDSYYQNARPEIVNLVPNSATKILELGCGAGHTGAAVKCRQKAHVTGIEMEATAALVAAKCLDQVWQEDIDSFEFPWEEESFDCIIAGDILEHLRDPWRVLRHAYRLLTPNGVIVVSIPNVGFFDIIHSLLTGRFDYEDAGLLDRTHLRFFTRSTFTEALLKAGFTLLSATPIFVTPGANEILRNSASSKHIQIGAITLPYESHSQLQDLLTYQWLLVGTRKSEKDLLGAQQTTSN